MYNIVRYLSGLILLAVGVALRIALDPWLGDVLSHPTVFIAVLFTAWFFGTGPAIISAVLGYVAIEYSIPDRTDWSLHYILPSLSLYITMNTVLVVFVRSLQLERASGRVREAKLKVVTQALSAAANGIAITDTTGTIVWVNDAFTKLTGYGGEEVIGITPRVLKSGKQSADFYRDLWATITRGEVWRGNIVNRRKDGSLYTEEMTITPVQFGGAITHYIAVKEDVTGKQRIEDALRESESSLKRAQEIAHLGSWELDLVNNHLTWSDETYRIFGIQPDKFAATYETFLEVVHPEDREAVLNAYSASLREGRDSYDIEHRIIRKITGDIRIVHEKCQHLRDEAGRAVRSLGMVHDITERKRVDEDLKRSRQSLREIFESVYDGIIVHGGSGEILDVNERYLEMYRLSREEALHLTIKDISGSSAPLDTLPLFWSETLDGKPQLFEWKARRPKDNSEFDVEVFLRAVSWNDQDVIMANVRDITDRKQREQQLKDADRRKDEFLAMLAHELRNPMAAISAAAAVLSVTDISEDKASFARKSLKQRIRQFARLIDDLLDVSRITTGKVQLQKEQFDISSAIQGAVESTKLLFEERGQQLVVRITEELPMFGDCLRLEQAITNLLSNAAKYMGQDGICTLTAFRDGSTGVIRVKDNGSGIDADLLPKIFDMFQQADTSLHRTSGGLGIGLTIAKKGVELQGGTISVRSEGIGRGSEFEIHIPLSQTVPDHHPEIGEEPPKEEGLRILVVEDHKDTALFAASLLQLQGFKVEMAFDGFSAIEVAERFSPDVVLLDIGLPGLDGFDVARRLRGSRLREAIIIAVTGYGQEHDVEQSLSAGIDHHLVKPVDYEKLGSFITEWRKKREVTSAVVP